MFSQSNRWRSAALVAAVVSAGCVALPTDVYVPDAVAGVLIYESCSLTPELPAGVKLQYSGLHAIVSIARSQDVNLVRVQFDVPDGSTLVLLEDFIKITENAEKRTRLATIPDINPAAPARYPETPAIQKLVLQVDSPLRGGRLHAGTLSFDRHYWIAAPVERDLGSEASLSLPEFSFNGTPARFPDIRFTRRLAIGSAFFNC